MTPEVIQQDGSHTFAASYDKVFAATVAALKSEGFPVASADPEKGMIKTGQKLIRQVAVGSEYTATATDITRQYVVHITRSGEGAQVAAEPRIFQGNAELTEQPVWVLDTPEGERALWTRLFRDIGEAL